MFYRLVSLIFILCALAVIIGFVPWLHRATDTLSILRPAFGLMSIAGLLFVQSHIGRLALAIAALTTLVTVIPPFLPQSAANELRLYSKNILASNSNTSALAKDIVEADPDVVMLQEVSTGNDGLLIELRKVFPHQHLCRFSGWSGIAVLSRHPFDGEPRCSTWRAIAAAPISFKGQRIWVASLHIPWPWPFESAEAEAAAETLLRSLDAPVVMAGDFNMPPWTQRVGRLARLSGTRLAGPARFTFARRNIPLPIDLALAPGGGSVARRPLLGSDHSGILADVSIRQR